MCSATRGLVRSPRSCEVVGRAQAKGVINHAPTDPPRPFPSVSQARLGPLLPGSSPQCAPAITDGGRARALRIAKKERHICLSKGWGAGIRTPIGRSRVGSPTVERHPIDGDGTPTALAWHNHITASIRVCQAPWPAPAAGPLSRDSRRSKRRAKRSGEPRPPAPPAGEQA
jgi:hypothetical protein